MSTKTEFPAVDVVDITEILIHWHAARSKSEMAESLAGGFQRDQQVCGVGAVPGRAAAGRAEWATRVRQGFLELADARLRQVPWPTVAGHRSCPASTGWPRRPG